MKMLSALELNRLFSLLGKEKHLPLRIPVLGSGVSIDHLMEAVEEFLCSVSSEVFEDNVYVDLTKKGVLVNDGKFKTVLAIVNGW